MLLETITLSRELVNQVLTHTQAAEPSATGVLLTHNGTLELAVRVADLSKSSVQQQLSKYPKHQLFAVYTSYADKPPIADLQHLKDSDFPELLHVLISQDIKGVLEMRGWRQNIAGDAVEAVKLAI